MAMTEEQQKHRLLMQYLLHKQYIRREYDNTVTMTSTGKERIGELFDVMTLGDVALLLIEFCESEGFKYHFVDGVMK